jgi:hypothetical protein
LAKLYNLARMTTATTGTGTITLGAAVSGCLSFAAAGVANAETISYAISDGANSEIGYGTYTASGTTLTRNVINSTNANAAISLSGSAQVFISPSAREIGKWTNRRVPQTGTSSLTEADCGATIALGGSAFYTYTVGAASGFDSDFAFKISNEDTTAGKTPAISGLTNFILWPGQDVDVYNQNNVWKVSPLNQRWIPNASFTGLNVDTTGAGNDANDGLAAGSGRALATIGQAQLLVQKYFDGGGANSVRINVVGTVTEQIMLSTSLVGMLQLVINGNTKPGQQNAWTLTSNQTAVAARDGGVYTIQGFKFSASGSGNTFLNPSQNGTIDYSACEFNANTSGVDIKIDQGGACNSLDTPGTTSNVTITNASPGVVSWTSHGLVANAPIFFDSTGTLPAPLSGAVVYYVSATGLTANTFQISATLGGASINTSSAGTGTQIAYANDTGYAINGNMGTHIQMVGPAKHNQGCRIRMPSNLTFTTFVNFQGSGACINWGNCTYVGPGNGSTGQKYAGNALGVFFSGGTTLPGATAGSDTNGALFL